MRFSEIIRDAVAQLADADDLRRQAAIAELSAHRSVAQAVRDGYVVAKDDPFPLEVSDNLTTSDAIAALIGVQEVAKRMRVVHARAFTPGCVSIDLAKPDATLELDLAADPARAGAKAGTAIANDNAIAATCRNHGTEANTHRIVAAFAIAGGYADVLQRMMETKRPTLRYERQHRQNRITVSGISHKVDDTTELVRTKGQIELRLKQEGGIGWNQRNLTLRHPGILSDTVLSALAGKTLSNVVDIESLRDINATITRAWLTGNPKSPHLTMLIADDRIDADELHTMRMAAQRDRSVAA